MEHDRIARQRGMPSRVLPVSSHIECGPTHGRHLVLLQRVVPGGREAVPQRVRHRFIQLATYQLCTDTSDDS